MTTMLFKSFLRVAAVSVGLFGVAYAEDLDVTLLAPLQGGETVNGVTTIEPLLIMPCKGATKPVHTGDGDFFIVFKNISKRTIAVVNKAAPVTLTFSTPTGTDLGKKWLPKEYVVHCLLAGSPPHRSVSLST